MSWLQTREASTLTIVGFAVSTALFIFDIQLNENGLKLLDVAPIGFLFGFIPLAYRQVTVWTIDRVQHNREVDLDTNSEDARFWRNRNDVYYGFAGAREFLLLWFISMPTVLWAIVCVHRLDGIIELQIWQTILGGAIAGAVITVIDLCVRVVDKIRHH